MGTLLLLSYYNDVRRCCAGVSAAEWRRLWGATSMSILEGGESCPRDRLSVLSVEEDLRLSLSPLKIFRLSILLRDLAKSDL